MIWLKTINIQQHSVGYVVTFPDIIYNIIDINKNLYSPPPLKGHSPLPRTTLAPIAAALAHCGASDPPAPRRPQAHIGLDCLVNNKTNS